MGQQKRPTQLSIPDMSGSRRGFNHDLTLENANSSLGSAQEPVLGRAAEVAAMFKKK